MKRSEVTGKVQTVLGIVDPDSLGITMMHEHLLTDSTAVYFVEPAGASEKRLAYEPVSLENLWWVRTHYGIGGNWHDVKLTDQELAIKEAKIYKLAGGNTIVELSNIGLSRDPLGLARISRATGLDIIMGSGYYIGASHPPELAARTEEEIADEILRDIMVGVGDTGVRAGIIGEIGCSHPLTEAERKVLRASAIAQRRTGAALNIHPSPSDDLVLEIIDILRNAGADLRRTIIDHVCSFGFSRDTLHKIADAGCYLEYDNFGIIDILPPYQGFLLEIPSDMQRINAIIQLINEGYIDLILMSNDTFSKHTLVSYGGYGYAHILREIVPVMRHKGVSEEQLHTLLVENPRRVLTFAPAA